MSDQKPLIREIRSRGYWRFVLRPTTYEEARFSRSELERMLIRCSVSLRGWDFPHISQRTPISRHNDGISQGTSWEHYREYWRFLRSGQFFYLGGFGEDWRDQSELWPGTYDPTRRTLGFVDTIFRFTEMFEFAARLTATDVGSPTMKLEVGLHGIEGCRFRMDQQRVIDFDPRPPITESSWADNWTGERETLIDKRSSLAIPMLRDLFDLQGLEIEREVIEFHQLKLFERRR